LELLESLWPLLPPLIGVLSGFVELRN
jgi:hypothetical protein